MKTFEERKKCLADICANHQQLNPFKTQIEQVSKEEKLNEIVILIQQVNIENATDINRQIIQCSNVYSADKPYGK
jgi:uncharacterized hydantoinase/oxoprolinase family protein